jgi:hypothetical protein
VLCGIARSRFSASNWIELLRQFESIFKTPLAHESGDPGVPFKEKKTEGRKSRETVPLKQRCGAALFLEGSGSW